MKSMGPGRRRWGRYMLPQRLHMIGLRCCQGSSLAGQSLLRAVRSRHG
jgi:hypothetical protein